MTPGADNSPAFNGSSFFRYGIPMKGGQIAARLAVIAVACLCATPAHAQFTSREMGYVRLAGKVLTVYATNSHILQPGATYQGREWGVNVNTDELLPFMDSATKVLTLQPRVRAGDKMTFEGPNILNDISGTLLFPRVIGGNDAGSTFALVEKAESVPLKVTVGPFGTFALLARRAIEATRQMTAVNPFPPKTETPP